MNYSVKHSTVYPGGHDKDPGYRSTVVVNAKGDREYHFFSHPDGSQVHRVETRKVGADSFRRLADRHAFAMHADLQAAIQAHLVELSDNGAFVVQYDVRHGGNVGSHSPEAERAWTETEELFFSSRSAAESFIIGIRPRAAYSNIKLLSRDSEVA